MHAFAAAWPVQELVQEALAQVTWYHNITLLEKLLVREKNRVLVEYALGNSAQPISVAEWETQLTRALPKELQGSLPTIEEIEAELSGDASVASGGGMSESGPRADLLRSVNATAVSPAPTFADGLCLLAHAANPKGVGYGG